MKHTNKLMEARSTYAHAINKVQLINGEIKALETKRLQAGTALKERSSPKKALEILQSKGMDQCCVVRLESRAREFGAVARLIPLWKKP